jgi:NADH-quinone oxidoreductase subunit N
VRVLLHGLGGVTAQWQGVLWWLAALTMVVGNLIALAQRQLKRMLAYSSVAHAGYLLTAVTAANSAGAGAFLFYAITYTLMTVGAFAVLAAVGQNGERDLLVDDLSGLGRQRPWLAAAIAIFMLSLLGFPGTAGFMGKWYILQAILTAQHQTLAVVLVLASVLSAGYYLPVVMVMYMKPARSDAPHGTAALPRPTSVVVAATAISLILFGVWPNRMLDVARRGGRDFKSTPTAEP